MIIVAIVLCAVLTLLNLLLVMGVLRRLRTHTDQIAFLIKNAPIPDTMMGPGERPDAFEATSIEGRTVTATDLSAGAIVAFFSLTCGSCAEWAPKFTQAAVTHPGGSSQVLAVVVAQDLDAASDMVATLRPAATVVVEPPDGSLAKAFKVHGFPSMCQLDESGAVETNVPPIIVAEPAAV